MNIFRSATSPLLGVFLFVLSTQVAWGQCSDTTHVYVDATVAQWQDTGVTVNPGDMIIIHASGESCAVASCIGCETPDGSPSIAVGCPRILPGIAVMSLIGAIGIPPPEACFNLACNQAPGNGVLLDDGRDVNGQGVTGQDNSQPAMYGPGFVGSKFSTIAQAAGNIHLALNDDTSDCFQDKCKGFDVTITRFPAGVVTASFFVDATVARWQDTGLFVLPGSHLIIEASGASCAIACGVGCEDPDGSRIVNVGCNPPNIITPNILPNIAFMSLIGAIGIPPAEPCASPLCNQNPGNGVLLDDHWDVDGPGISGSFLGKPGMYGPGFVGSKFSTIAQAAGNIHFAVNDDAFNCFSDNCKGFNVTIYATCAECVVHRFCGQTRNPQNGAVIDINTCSLTASAINVSLSSGPPGLFCYLLVSDGDDDLGIPPGAVGTLCLGPQSGGSIGRYIKDVGQITGSGSFNTDILNGAHGQGTGQLPNPPGGQIMVGETWYFQYWHRQSGGQPSTFSDAIRVQFSN